MKNFAIQNRVLQRDRVLQRRVLERYYCIHIMRKARKLFSKLIVIVKRKFVYATGSGEARDLYRLSKFDI